MNPYENAMAQLEKAAKVKDLGKEFINRLHYPDRDIRVSIPVRMDNGELKIYEAYRVEYNNTLGPYKGGIRYHHLTDINEVKALAFWMTLKCAVAGIPMGGGKGGITVNPKELSKNELELLSRGWVKKMADFLGPHKDVPAPDVNTTSEIMQWMSDEYEKISGDKTKATFTGKPISYGGSEGREQATGLGGLYVFEALRKKLDIPDKCKIAIQVFGNVGEHAAKILYENGHKIVAISDSKGGIYNENGISVDKLKEYKKKTGSMSGFEGAENITNDELIKIECDLLIPAALENAINQSNAGDIKAKVIMELANGPITPEADEILYQKNIPVIPDILANSGGVTTSYFEWNQNLKNEHWSEEEVSEKLRNYMKASALAVFDEAKNLNTDLRRGAFIVALERIKERMQ